MTLLEYIKLDEISKNNLILEKGVLLDVYPEKNKSISLFSLHNFFVEVIISEEEKIILEVIPYESNFRLGQMQKQKKDYKDSIVKSLNNYFLI